jgi:hypothetical protein
MPGITQESSEMFTYLRKTKTIVLLLLLYFSSAALAGGKNETAITIWLVMFNNPAECATDPCMESDIFVPATMTGVCYLAGQSVQANGRVTISGRFAEGTNHGCIIPVEGGALLDSEAAEVHMVLQQHGWSLMSGDGLEGQVGEFLGNCNPIPATSPDPADYGSCADTQFSIHRPGDANAGVSASDVLRFPPALTMVDGANTVLIREPDGIRMSVHTRLDEED